MGHTLSPTKFLKMKYSLSDAFTASAEKTPILRLGDGATRFRIISDTFVQCFSLFVKTSDGKGYSKLWEHDSEQPELDAGHEYEKRKPKKVVLFKAVTEEEPNKAQILAAPITVTEQLLEEANERDGLTVSWFKCTRTGSGMNTQYRVRSEEPTAFNSDWADLAAGLDFSEAMQ